jgi:aryl-alcohol dehydrogenase-like predicted oxidoreductase
VIVKEALANGRLTDRAQGEHLADLKAAARSRGGTLDAIAIAAALAQPWADVVLSGAVTGDQLDSNLEAVGLVCKADTSDWTTAVESATEYWAHRSALSWQ